MVLDPQRREREISKLLLDMDDDATDAQDVDLSNCGKMILLPSEKLSTHEVVPLYYTRQVAERTRESIFSN